MVRNSLPETSAFVSGMLALLGGLSGAAFLINAKGRIVAANRVGRNVFGIGPEPVSTCLPIRPDVLNDILGSDQAVFHVFTTPQGDRLNVSCTRVSAEDARGPYILVQESNGASIASKFVQAHRQIQESRLMQDRVARAEAKMQAEVARWRHLSMTDRMTGLLNATGFRDRVSERLAGQDRATILYADLNGFKSVNDRMGHSAGDKLLHEIAQSLDGAIRNGDIAGRMGGDEFAVYLPGCDVSEDPEFLDRLRKTMSRRFPVLTETGGTRTLTVQPAIGTASFPQDGKTLTALLECADRRMYADKARAKLGADGANSGIARVS